MTTVSQTVKRMIDSKPILQESMIEEVINYSNLAVKLKPQIESELGKKVKVSAIVMALRRHAEKLQRRTSIKEPFEVSPEVILKTNICDICLVKTPSAVDKIKDIYRLVDDEKGDTLNVIQGNYEITIVISQKHLTRRTLKGTWCH